MSKIFISPLSWGLDHAISASVLLSLVGLQWFQVSS